MLPKIFQATAAVVCAMWVAPVAHGMHRVRSLATTCEAFRIFVYYDRKRSINTAKFIILRGKSRNYGCCAVLA